MTRINCIPPEELHDKQVARALKECDYYIQKTANKLGIGRAKLYGLIKRYNIKVPARSGAPKKYTYSNEILTNMYYKMLGRCYNKQNKDYKYYGARGVGVCESWRQSRDNFFTDCRNLPNAFVKGFSIDRIDNNGNYEPSNVRFIPHIDQCNNRRSNRVYTYKGKQRTLAQHAKEHGLTWAFLRDRLGLGWTIEDAIETPKGVVRHDSN